MKLIILSGRSGSGKTVALHTLEDLGYYCIDNLPVKLLPEAVQQVRHNHALIAVGIDARALIDSLDEFDTIMAQIDALAISYEIIFLDADDATLIKRFSDNRRKHPLSRNGLPLQEALTKEYELLTPIARRTHLLIDTSRLNQNQLYNLIRKRITNRKSGQLNLMFESFGYKFGVPADADYVFDARCLPNPHWLPELRPLTGKDQLVIEFLEKQPLVSEFVWQVQVFLKTWIPRFATDNRNYLTIAIGCTGGQHRSVYIAEQLAQYFNQGRDIVSVRHRELNEEQ